VCRAPSYNVIKTLVSRWRETGNVRDIKCPGQQPSVCMPENSEHIRNAVLQSPQRSVQQQASALGKYDQTVRMTLHIKRSHPYKMCVIRN
jgi:hypothetical protein